jgi:hypothetical protein
MKRRLTAIAIVMMLAAVPALAHPGHQHKVMGTVSAVRNNALDVKGTDGKALTIRLTDKTRIVRNTTVLKAGDIKVGSRVVVTMREEKDATGRQVLTADEVRLGTAPMQSTTTTAITVSRPAPAGAAPTRPISSRPTCA